MAWVPVERRAEQPLGRRRIQKSPDVCGGAARIVGTRIPVWVLVVAKQRGDSRRAMLENYPSLTLNDLVAAWRYAGRHPQEIRRSIRENSLR